MKTRVSMPFLDPKTRIYNFSEVALGYSAVQAKEEASRCLECKHAPCIRMTILIKLIVF
jgi:glutamate synthase (NADPH/NADH) small chain